MTQAPEPHAPQELQVPEPALTMPPAEAEAIRAAYEGARVILEYGSGGSTALAARLPGKRVFSVESDPDWVAMMRAWLAQNPPAARVHIIHADIGPTKAWGYPKDNRGWARYHTYPLKPWQRRDFEEPDVVLVDGRFRAGCMLATTFSATRPLTMFVDDYIDRPAYHEAEEFTGPPAEMIGRMARFEITPTPLPPRRLMHIMTLMNRFM